MATDCRSTHARHATETCVNLSCMAMQILITDSSNIFGNSANSGGAMYLTANCSASIDASSISNNSASFSGGAVHQEGSSVAVITGSSVTSNTGPWGGGLHCADTARLTVTGRSRVQANSAYTGGGLYALGSCKVRD